MLMNRDEGGELRLPMEELEDSSSHDLATMLGEGPITRARAIKLGGAALLAGTGLMTLFQSPAEARRRRRKRRRKKAVTTDPRQVDFGDQPVGLPSTETVTVENNGTEPVTVSLSPDSDNEFTFDPDPSIGFNPSAPILPGTSAEVPIVFTPAEQGVDYSGQLLVLDANGNTVTASDLAGTGA